MGQPTAHATSRQAEILDLIGEGFSSKEIGRRLGISARTVETHIQHFYMANHVRARGQAIKLWERQRAIDKH